MSSARRHDTHLFRAISIAFALAIAAVVALLVQSTGADASKSKAAAGSSKLPKISKVKPNTGVVVGTKLTLTGTHFVKGKKKLVVIFKRDGSKRSFTARGDATSTTKATVKVPDVSGDLLKSTGDTLQPLDNMYRLRPITKYGAAKGWTNTTISPKIIEGSGGGKVDTSSKGDCDNDGIANGVDSDDDNDLLADTTELTIGTDVCKKDTDGDTISDFYEYTVAYALNGGPTLPYPSLRPYPNPLVKDDGDYDNDKLTTLQEYNAWQYTGLMTHFYSDADGDSNDNGVLDPAEDEDHDLLPNHIELYAMNTLNWLKTDTDGDGLCDGLDDEDHDGPPTSLAQADCATPVPNNGPSPAFPPTDPLNTVPGGDPNPAKIDGDDNQYSNFYEWYNEGADPDVSEDMYEPCTPSIYPVSPYCHEGHVWDPFPVG
jgi:hypothetical protein